jgi:membrane protein
MINKLMMQVKKITACVKEAFTAWNERDAFSASAVIAYYAIFSLPGLLVIVINVAGYFWGKEAVTSEIMTQVKGIIGQDTAGQIQDIVARASVTKGSVISSILGIATILFGATGVFYHVQQIFNKIWEVKPKPKQKFLKLLRDRLFSFGLILVIGFLLLISLVISAALSALSTWVTRYLSDSLLFVFSIADIIISVGIITVLFAAMYKFLPDVKIKWRDVWPGAFLTTILFVIAKYALGLYFGKSHPGSTYGTAGSIILIMLWVSYAALVLLYGAEFTRVYAKQSGKFVQPKDTAEKDNVKAATGFGSRQKNE